MKASAVAPSIRRWSKPSEMTPIGRIAIVSMPSTSRTTTSFWMRPTPRMARFGWLMTGVPMIAP